MPAQDSKPKLTEFDGVPASASRKGAAPVVAPVPVVNPTVANPTVANPQVANPQVANPQVANPAPVATAAPVVPAAPLIGPVQAPAGARPAPLLPYMMDFGVPSVIPGGIAAAPAVNQPTDKDKKGSTYTQSRDYTVAGAPAGATGEVDASLKTGNGWNILLADTQMVPKPNGTNVTDGTTFGAQIKDGTGTLSKENVHTVEQRADGSSTTTGSQYSAAYGKGIFTLENTNTSGTSGGDLTTSAANTNSVAVNTQDKSITLANTQTQETEFAKIEDENERKSTSEKTIEGTVGANGASLSVSEMEQGPGDAGKTGAKVNVGFDTQDQTLNIGGEVLNDGSGVNGGMDIGTDGQIKEVEVGGTQKLGDTTVKGNLAVSENETTATASAKNGEYGGGVAYTDTHDKYTSSVAQSGNNAAVSTTLTNQQTLSANAQVPVFSASAAATGGTTWQITDSVSTATGAGHKDATDVDTEKLKQEQPALAATLQTQKTLAGKLEEDGLEGLDLTTDLAAQGFNVNGEIQFTSYNGWNASGGARYGALSASMGGGRSTANQVTLKLDDADTMTVSVMRQENVSGQVGAGVFGIEAQVGGTGSDRHSDSFEIDLEKYNEVDPVTLKPKNPELVEAVDLFMRTGLMPGAGNINTPAAQAAYGELTTSVDAIDQMTARMKTLESQGVLTDAERTELRGLQTGIDCAQMKIDTCRNALNNQWSSEFGPNAPTGPDGQPRSEPLDGIKLTSTTDSTSREQRASTNLPVVGNLSLGGASRTWVESAFKGAGDAWEFAKTYSEQYFNIGGSQNSLFVGGTSTDKTGAMFTMYAEDDIYGDQLDIVKGMQNRDITDAALDKYGHVDGRMMVSFDAHQMAVMSAELNDIKDPQSKDMWLQMGASAADCIKNDPTVYGEISARDPETSPSTRALEALAPGDVMAQVAAAQTMFAKVTTPEQFQALDPDQQSLYIELVQNASGSYGDFAGTGNANAFNTLAPIMLMDEKYRMEELAKLQETANKAENRYSDNAAFEMIDFIQTQFADDPAAMAQLQPGMAFDWKQDRVEEMAKLAPEDLTKQFADAYNHTTLWFGQGDVHDPDEDRSLDALLAANESRGPEAVTSTIQQAGIDPVVLLRAFPPDKAVERQMYIDLLMATPYADVIRAELECKAL